MKRPPLYPSTDMPSMRAFLERSVELFGDKTALMELEKSGEISRTSYTELYQDVQSMGTSLILRRLGSSRIALIGENSYPWIMAYFSIVCSGATVVPLDKELTVEELADQIQRSRVAAICYTDQYSEEAQDAVDVSGCDCFRIALGKAAGDISVKDMVLEGRRENKSGNDLFSEVEIDGQQLCSILFTSGTTGTSKGVMLSHENITSNIKSAIELVYFSPEDILLSILPLHHCFEDICGLFGALYHGTSIALCPGVKLLPKYLETFSPTVMALVPLYIETFHSKIFHAAEESGSLAQLKAALWISCSLQRIGLNVSSRLLKRPRAALGGSLRIIVSGGAPLDAHYIRDYRGLGISILHGYGTTECSPVISVNRNNSNKDGSSGWIASCCEVKTDSQGQILVRGQNVMQGYLDDPQATSDVFEDGWFATGDLGHVDEDQFLFITGRCKDLIVLKNGKNVMPQEVEEKLMKSPLIAEALVCGGDEDANGIRNLSAIIYPEPTLAYDSDTLQRLIGEEVDKTNKELVYYKRIANFSLRNAPFERTTTKKIKRYLIHTT